MIRSSKHTLKFTNKEKRQELTEFFDQYLAMVKKYVNILWNNYQDDPPNMLKSKLCNLIKTEVEFDSRIRQCAAKQACSMVNSVVTKRNKRLYKLKELQKEGKSTKHLQRKIDLTKFNKPNCENINIELDPRFVDIEPGNSFDLFVQIKQIGNKRSIRIPIKHTRISKKWFKQGIQKASIRLTPNEIILFFEVKPTPNKAGTRKVGVDQGSLTCVSMSKGSCECKEQVTIKDKDGWDLDKIQEKLARRKYGSKGFKKAQDHRKNYINWSINRLNFDGIKTVGFEKIHNIRKGKQVSRKMKHWTYTLIKTKFIRLSEEKGFVFTEQDNKFMSQRCSQCGWTHKSNRKGKTFKCTNTNCGFFADSDLNAASNHEVELIELPQSIWHEHKNRTTGFFWFENSYVFNSECIVPNVKAMNDFL